MEMVAASVDGKRMAEEGALQGASGDNELSPDFEIGAGLGFGPGDGSFFERLERRRAMAVACDASGVSGTLLQKDGLDTLLEEVVIERGLLSRGKPEGWQGEASEESPCGHLHLVPIEAITVEGEVGAAGDRAKDHRSIRSPKRGWSQLGNALNVFRRV